MAQRVPSFVAGPFAAEDLLVSTPTADDNAAKLQPFMLAQYAYSSSRAALDAGPGRSAAASHPRPTPVPPSATAKPKFHWKPALWQSARFLLVMHAFRLATEPSTRAELKGKFWGDYWDSVLGTGGWGDGDPMMVNYVGHPMEGSVAGFIYLQNDDNGRNLDFNIRSKAYWKSRLWASLWAGVFSLQFEMGPLSEASIGNVGKEPRPNGGSYMASVDLVITPTIGMAWMLSEDILDKYAVRGVEKRTENRVARALARGFLNPSRAFANMMRGKAPWYRDNRPLSGHSSAARSPAPATPSTPVPATRSGH